MDLKIAVCDDSAADRRFIAEIARSWAKDTGHDARITEFPSAESFLFEFDGGWDILLLDIEMGGMDGVELAKRLREKSATLQIVFITGYSEYIEEGYEVEALHYLVKPVDPSKLRSVLTRAVGKLTKNEKALTLDSGGETVRVPVYEIRCAEVRGNYVTLHANTDVTVKMTLGELMDMLDDRFYRVSRWAAVNLTRVSRVSRTEVTLTDGSVIPLPRGAWEGINRAIISLR